MRFTRWWIAALIGAMATGCGSPNPFSYVKVTGRVTLEDGTPVPTGQVIFESQAPPKGNMHPRPGVANLNQDGTFDAVTSYKYGDGLVPGKHKVVIMFATDENGRPLVAEEYTSMLTTPLMIDTADAPLEIKVRKPAN